MRFIILLGLILGGFLLRAQRLDWQPLWWDEGISIYFATESLTRMVQLTANDIHPPLYYALLHLWSRLFESAAPQVARLFSVLVGTLAIPAMAWLGHTISPTRPRRWLIATLLLTLNPMHLFYSQEVRMYALAMLLGMISTAFFWILVREKEPINSRRASFTIWFGYVASTTLALYTIYYSGFLFLAHGLWALWMYRRRLAQLWRIAAALITVALLYLPWILYTGGRLVQYVDDKVVADNDTPLGLLAYLYRHGLAFTAGHLALDSWVVWGLLHVGLLALVGVACLRLMQVWQSRKDQKPAGDATAEAALWTLVLAPITIGFVLNLRLPFFPDGGERLLLFVLPYVLLLIAAAIDTQWNWRVGRPALLALLLCASTGVAVFYTLPRYPERDYRPIVSQVVQRGRDTDTWLALFPWQMGYWRAYAPFPLFEFSTSSDAVPGPQPLLVGQGSLMWGPQISSQIDAALSQGTLWLPAPLSFGSDLPLQIEAYLEEQSERETTENGGETPLVNVESGWVNANTRLSAWSSVDALSAHSELSVDFGPLQLLSAAVAPDSVTSANVPLHVSLAWSATEEAASDLWDISLSLQDETGHTWTGRDYRQAIPSQSEPVSEAIGLLIPVGLPPGTYDLLVGVRPAPINIDVDEGIDVDVDENTGTGISAIESDGSAPTALQTTLASGEIVDQIAVAQLVIESPTVAMQPWRLPIQHPVDPPARHQDVALLGYSGYDDDQDGAAEGTGWLAGDEVEVTLFFQDQGENIGQDLYISLLDEGGAGVAGWSGWPLPAYPLDAWPAGALVRVPVRFALPATLASGRYRLVTGLLDPPTGAKTDATLLGQVAVSQRTAHFEPTAPAAVLDVPVQFGTHAELIGYDWQIQEASAGVEFELQLHWHVLQTLLPPHHIFVHADAAVAPGSSEGLNTLVQDDGPPFSVTPDGLVSAPTGSWQPGEYLVTHHSIPLPLDVRVDADSGLTSSGDVAYPWRVGLYLPDTGARLPATVAGQPGGDYAEFPRLEP